MAPFINQFLHSKYYTQCVAPVVPYYFSNHDVAKSGRKVRKDNDLLIWHVGSIDALVRGILVLIMLNVSCHSFIRP